MEYTTEDLRLGSALDSLDGELIIEWMKKVAGYGATAPPMDSTGRYDAYMSAWHEGQRALIDKVLLAKETLHDVPTPTA